MSLTVYADVLVIVNLYIDFFLLWCVKKFLRLRAKSCRLVLGALTGALCSLTALAPSLPPAVSLLTGAAAALLMAAAAFAPTALRMFLKTFLCLWAFSFLLAGFFLFVIRFFAPGNVLVLGSVIYFDLSPLLLFLFTCGAYGVLWICRRLFPPGDSRMRFCILKVENQGNTVKLFAKADTGCSLREPFSGLPVLVCEKEDVKEAAPPQVLAFFEQGKSPAPPEPPQPGLRLVPFESMGGSGVLPAFRPRQVTVAATGTPVDCYVAVYAGRLSAGQFNALYNPDLFPESADFSK